MPITDNDFLGMNDSDWVNLVDETDGSWTVGEASGGATDSNRNRMFRGGRRLCRMRNGHWVDRNRLYNSYRRRRRRN